YGAGATVYTFLLFALPLMFFRAESVADGVFIVVHTAAALPGELLQLFSGHGGQIARPALAIAPRFALAGVTLLGEFLAFRGWKGNQVAMVRSLPMAPRYAVYYAIVYVTLAASDTAHPA